MKKVNITFPALGLGLAIYMVTQETASAHNREGTLHFPNGSAVAYIKKYFPLAEQTEKLYGVPALVTIAQAGIEGAWGNSRLAREGNNHFGIKADPRWKGPTIGSYRKYNSIEDSFTDHAKFLATNHRYNKAFLTRDPKEFLKEISFAKYSEDPDYNTIVSRAMDIASRVK